MKSSSRYCQVPRKGAHMGDNDDKPEVKPVEEAASPQLTPVSRYEEMLDRIAAKRLKDREYDDGWSGSRSL